MNWAIDNVPPGGLAIVRIGGFESRGEAEAYVQEEGLSGDIEIVKISGASLGKPPTEAPVLILPPGRTKFFNWSRNEKMRATGSAIAFPLPAFESDEILRGGKPFRVCPGAGRICKVCYAHKAGFYTMDEAVACREHNLALILNDGYDAFVEMIGFDLSHMGWEYIRIHDSGDFFDQEYLDAWFEVARRDALVNPGRIFYAYTKSLHLDFSGQPDNFRIVQSYGGAYDEYIDWDKPVAVVFPPGEEGRRKMEEEGFEYCSDDDRCAISQVHKIGLEYHHSSKRTLDEEEKVEFLS